jgi:hypothetical protein
MENLRLKRNSEDKAVAITTFARLDPNLAAMRFYGQAAESQP